MKRVKAMSKAYNFIFFVILLVVCWLIVHEIIVVPLLALKALFFGL